MDIQEIFSPDTSNKLTSAILGLDESLEKFRKLHLIWEKVIQLYSDNFNSKQFLQDLDLVAIEKRFLEKIVTRKKTLQTQETRAVGLIKAVKWLSQQNDERGLDPDMGHEILEMAHKLIDLFTESFQILKDHANLEYVFGKVYVAKGIWYQGLKHLEISLLIQREFDDFNARAATVYEIGRVHQLLDNSDEARMRYRDALRLYQHVGNLKGVMACKLALGNIAAQQGFVEEGVKLLQETKQFYMAHNQEELTQNVESVLQFLNQVKEKQPA